MAEILKEPVGNLEGESEMGLEADEYTIKLRFERLFADPRIFDDPSNLVRRYFETAGLEREKTHFVYQTSDDLLPVDDAGHPSVSAGIGKFRYQGKMLRSEFMQGANLRIEYVDFGSGLVPEDHRKLWVFGRWDNIAFETREFNHRHMKTNVAKVSELYEMLKISANPTTIATVELPGLSGSLLRATVRYLEDQLKPFVGKDDGTLEVYAGIDLDHGERKALETRLAREGTDSTVYVILSIPYVKGVEHPELHT